MTRTRPAQHRATRQASHARQNRRGMAMMLIMVAVVLATILAVSFLHANSATTGVAHNMKNLAHARSIAESGLEMAMSSIRADTDWRTNHNQGVWVNNQPLGGGTVTLSVYDGTDTDGDGVIDGDNDLADDATDTFTVVANAIYQGVTYTAQTSVTVRSLGSAVKILMIVPDTAALSQSDTDRVALLRSWGMTVSLLRHDATLLEYNAAVLATLDGVDNAAVYISSTAAAASVGTKLNAAAIGVVTEQGGLAATFNVMSQAGTAGTGSTISVTNNTHYITEGFATGNLTTTGFNQGTWTYSGTLAPAGSTLAGSRQLVIVDADGQLLNSTFAAGRRVLMPWGGAAFNPVFLSDSGKLLLKRALLWASESAGSGGPINTGYQTAFGNAQKNAHALQTATQVVITRPGTITGITAYVQGPPPKLVRYALYGDTLGQPGDLIVQSDATAIVNNSPYWHTVRTPETAVPAGIYWLAIAFEHSNENYYYEDNVLAKHRTKNHDAVTNNYASAWGASASSGIRRISIYANLTPASTGSGSGSGSGSGGVSGSSGTGGVTYDLRWEEEP